MNHPILCTLLVFCLVTSALSESLLNRLLDTKPKYRRMWETERSGEELDENNDFTIKRGRARKVNMLAQMHGTAGIAGKRSPPSADFQFLGNCPQLRSVLGRVEPDWLLSHLDEVLAMCESTQMLGQIASDTP